MDLKRSLTGRLQLFSLPSKPVGLDSSPPISIFAAATVLLTEVVGCRPSTSTTGVWLMKQHSEWGSKKLLSLTIDTVKVR